MTTLIEQLKQRRMALGLKQHDMLLRVGMSRQQYQQLESRGNPRLATLELVAQGLNSQLMLVPKEKLQAVQALLEQDNRPAHIRNHQENDPLDQNPWHGLLPEDDEGDGI